MNKMTTIHCISTKDSVLKLLINAYADQGVRFVEKWPKEIDTWQEVQVLLIIEPVKIGREYYAISKLWKNWLFKHAPHVRLLLATHGVSEHINVINLLNLPADLESHCQGLLPVSEFVLRRKPSEKGQRDVFFDPWIADLPLSGRDAKRELERFLNGHDKNSSFYSQMVSLRNQVQNLNYFSMKEGQEASEKIARYRRFIKRSQAHLQNRWHQYEHLMKYLPFQTGASKLEEDLNKLKLFLKSPGWRNLQVLPEVEVSTIDSIRDTAQEHFVPYVFTTG